MLPGKRVTPMIFTTLAAREDMNEANAYVEQWTADAAPSYFELSAGGQKIAVHHSEEEVGTGGAIYHLEVADIDALHATVTDAGIEAKPPADTPWKWRMFFVRDPDGHVLGFYQPLS